MKLAAEFILRAVFIRIEMKTYVWVNDEMTFIRLQQIFESVNKDFPH